MSDIIIPGITRQREYPSWAVKAVDGMMLKIKKEGLWPTVDFIVRRWIEKDPKRASEYRQAVKGITDTRATETGAGKGKTGRWLLEIPPDLMGTFDLLIRPEIEKDKKKFWHTFARKYPIFRVAKKV